MYTATKRIIGGAALITTGMYLVAVLISVYGDGGFEIGPELVAGIMTSIAVLGITWVVMQVADYIAERNADELQVRLDAAQAAIVDEAVAAIRRLDAERTEEIHVRVLSAVTQHTKQVLDQVRTTMREEVRTQLGQVKDAGVRRGLTLAIDADDPSRGIASVHLLRTGERN